MRFFYTARLEAQQYVLDQIVSCIREKNTNADHENRVTIAIATGREELCFEVLPLWMKVSKTWA